MNWKIKDDINIAQVENKIWDKMKPILGIK